MTATTQFEIDLFEEHLMEGSYLMERRRDDVADLAFLWPGLADYEERLEAHLEGLLYGGETALKVCQEANDAGEIYMAARVFCRKKRYDLMAQLMEDMDWSDPQRCDALGRALAHEHPTDWFSLLVEAADEDYPELVPVLMYWIGYRRELPDHTFLDHYWRKETCRRVYAHTCGRLRSHADTANLMRLLIGSKDNEVRAEAALALLRIGHAAPLEQYKNVTYKTWTLIGVGLAGDLSHVDYFKKVVRTEGLRPQALTTLGLLGVKAAVRILLYHLEIGQEVERAAQALNLITGAELYEEAFVPEPVDEAALTEDELKAVRAGGPHTNPDGSAAGENVVRLTTDHAIWKQWWQENKNRFRSALRYRSGKRYGPEALLENLRGETTPGWIREFAAWEFLVRYGVDIPFEPDMPIAEQRKAIQRFAEWVEESGKKFKPGTWYLHGKPVN